MVGVVFDEGELGPAHGRSNHSGGSAAERAGGRRARR